MDSTREKNKFVAAFLSYMLGGFGVHRFYLGQTGLGLVYLLFFWTFIPLIISFFETFYFLFMSDEDFDRKYNLKKMLEERLRSHQLPPPQFQSSAASVNGVDPRFLDDEPYRMEGRRMAHPTPNCGTSHLGYPQDDYHNRDASSPYPGDAPFPRERPSNDPPYDYHDHSQGADGSVYSGYGPYPTDEFNPSSRPSRNVPRPADISQIRAKLEHLNTLRQEGLISESEYRFESDRLWEQMYA